MRTEFSRSGLGIHGNFYDSAAANGPDLLVDLEPAEQAAPLVLILKIMPFTD
jgi:hypothetical protein